jgi:hypothetical protein
MSLKGNGTVIDEDVTLSCSDVADVGLILCYGTAGSGTVLGDTAGFASLKSNPSGQRPCGMLMTQMVNDNETKVHRNFQRITQQIGGPCNLLKKGVQTVGGVLGTPAPGGIAYLTANGILTATVSPTGGRAATPPVGEFKGVLDADGFVAVEVNLPILS